jgi:hypothetical protein
VTVPLVNVDRFDRMSLEFHSQAIDEPVLDDLSQVHPRARLVVPAPRAPCGLHGTPTRRVML